MKNEISMLLIERGWTLGRLAAKTGLHKSYLCRISQGKRNPSVRAAMLIASAFGLSVEEIFRPDAGKRALKDETAI
jgi:transcriptional regulator with XRE-family HTH domain